MQKDCNYLKIIHILKKMSENKDNFILFKKIFQILKKIDLKKYA